MSTIAEIFNEQGILTDEAMKEFEKRGTSVSCECPEHLVGLLRSVKEFTKYQENCLIEKPQDEVIHNWLKATSVNLEHLLSSTIVSLARMEGMLNDKNEFESDD